jgi:tetratricopeptide (TPR) repeat protein
MRILALLLFALISPLQAFAAELPDRVRFAVTLEVGNLAMAREWLDSGLNPDFEGSRIGSGIMIGAWEGNIPLMELFYGRGADINKTNAFGEQAVQLAAWKGQTEAVRWLVERGAKLDRVGKEWSALHYAAFAGHGEIVSFLVQRGANVNALSTNGSTPLMMAAREGKEGIADMLLGAGARVDIANDNGEHAVQWAMRHNNLTIARRMAGEKFAEFVARPQQTYGPAIRSQAVPDRADQLMAKARHLESFGRFDEAAKLYREAFASIKRADAAQVAKTKKVDKARTVTGITITARRADPQAQTAGVSYATPATDVKPESRTEAPTDTKVGAGGTAPAVVQDAADNWLRQAQALEAAGKRKEAIAAYRQAAAALRSR